MNLFSVVLALVVLIVALVILGASALQQFLMYHPAHERVAPADAGLAGVEERMIETPDGNSLVAWWAKAAPGKPTVLYFHGNAGGLIDRSGRIRRMQGEGIGVYMMAYRGYSGSTGRPTERDNVADGRRAFDALVAAGVEPENIFIFGESLGTGVAVQVATKRAAAGLVLDAPYTSMLDLAHLHYPYLPSNLFLRDRYETQRHIANVTVPLLIVHGRNDAVIPFDMGQAIYDRAPSQQKEIVDVPGAGHLDHDRLGSFDAIIKWMVARTAAPTSTGSGPSRVSGE
ncbi:MAG: alpha/beta hydrolase [Hyphomicrobiaceae bacterium]|nr:alpha/beta hydrolase [Hyphomicrobiaceae bacterium]